MEQTTCQHCAYFVQHYAFNKKEIFRVYCGHCIFPRLKTKRPDSKSCIHYVPSEPDEEAFVTKEYLSKFLLDYMRDLDLLPEIQELSMYDKKAPR